MHFILWLALMNRMTDTKLTVSQRSDACYELRGVTAPSVILEMRRALADPLLRACAGTNLRKAGAVEELKSALVDENFEVRATAARELGGFERPELLPLLRSAARDRQLVVAANAIEGMASYGDPVVLPYLLDIAKEGGLIGTAALNRARVFRDPGLVAVARELLKRPDVSDRLSAMVALADLGDATDVPALREIAAKETEMVSSKGRGFGLMPAISLSHAAQTTIEKIEARGAESLPRFEE
jgi:HEAT repeat protein